jgi:CRISPR-associated protein Csm2
MPNKDANQVIDEISKLATMRDLSPSRFADETGLANTLAKSFGKDGLKATQLRKVFHALKEIERKVNREIKGGRKKKNDTFETQELTLLMPDLAYAKGRGLIPDEFYKVLRLSLRDKVKTYEDFERAMQFIEAVMAYHKFNYPSGSRG